VRVEREAGEGDELCAGNDEDEEKGDEEVMMNEEDGVDAYNGRCQSLCSVLRERDVPKQMLPAAYSGVYGRASSRATSVSSYMKRFRTQ
jgi:hypothetical protein